MALKLTLQGCLIYATMLAYLGTFVALMTRRKDLGRALYLAGFAVAVVSFAYRWYDVGHAPLQNLFEVFICLGMLMYPLSLFCRRFLGVGGEGADALMAFIILFPAGLVFKAESQQLPPALQSWLFVPHVAAYMIAYVVLIKAGVQAVAHLLMEGGPVDEALVPHEEGTYRMVRFGFPVLTLGLVLGAVWGKLAWGDYWNWDPKELWSFVTWLVYVEYLHVRHMFGTKHPRLNATLALGGSVAIVITLLWVNLARLFSGGLHSYA